MDERGQSRTNIDQGRTGSQAGGGTQGGGHQQSSGRGTATEQTQDVSQYLRGCSFPCRKEELVRVAKNNNAPQDVISKLQGLGNDQFRSIDDVRNKF